MRGEWKARQTYVPASGSTLAMVERAFDLSRLGAKVAHPEIPRTPEIALTSTVRALRRRRVPFLLHGAWALAAYGYARATEDFDFIVSIDKANVRRLERAMDDLGAFRLKPAARTHVMYNALGWRLDFFLEPSKRFAGLRRRSTRRRFLRMVLPIVSREDLIRRKLARGSLQDRADVERLRRSEP